MEEIDAAVEDGVISFPVTYAQAQKLPFLQACLKETLRYHPAVNWTLPRVIPEGGATILGRFYPAGCEGASTSLRSALSAHATSQSR